MKTFESLRVTKTDAVGKIEILPPDQLPIHSTANLHWELAEAVTDFRLDNDIRVVVLTGMGDKFLVVRPGSSYREEVGRRHRTDPKYMWETFTATAIMHEQIAQMEKPVIARVNGDAIGFGSSMALCCDLIVAREDARFIDTHMGMGEIDGVGPDDFALVPGDGGTALVPAVMSPALAKEYLMLSRPMSAIELARLGVINYAVPRDQLDTKVDSLVERLLKRSAYALAWTKRAANRSVAEHVVKGMDAGMAYEMVNFLHWEKMGWRDSKRFDASDLVD
jgi:enoyl-CoA hydratase